jgi:hypothetical protein
MKKYFIHIISVIAIGLLLTSCVSVKVDSTKKETQVVQIVKEPSTFVKLASIENVFRVEIDKTNSHFKNNYEVWFNQPIDYNDPSKGTFPQRVLLGFVGDEKPVIVELQGYGIYTDRAGELANHYQANQLTIEHRYFNNSRPEVINWNTLTVEAAAKDQAYIISKIREALYPTAKFVTTGISKGCQTTMVHRRYFPNNVDASVCYVGPLNFKREDPRIYSFLKNVGTAEDRAKIKAFQEICFQRKDALLEMFKEVSEKNNYTWEMGIEKALFYSILEYPFAFWQWGTSTSTIPPADASDEIIYNHLFGVSGYGFFEENAVDNLQPYFWAALTEQGIYGYETAPFKKYTGTDKIYDFQWAFPKGIEKEYNLKPMQEIKSFLDNSAEKMLFIYGEYDAWSATAVDLSESAKTRDMHKFVKEKGDHRTRIRSFSDVDQQTIYSIIDSWIK